MSESEKKKTLDQSRRQFLKASLMVGAAGLAGSCARFGIPNIVPARVIRKSPNGLIQVAQIGCGRIGNSSEIPGVLKQSELARIVACCDLDSIRLAATKEAIEGKQAGVTIKTYSNYHEILADPSIDAVCLSLPDFWHGQAAVEAALAGKHIYLQKPAAITIQEGRQMADMVKRMNVVLQMGSQQRSESPYGSFRKGVELVRNGAIGKLKEVHVGLPTDPEGKPEVEMPVPATFDYNTWLGATPEVFYTEKRCHPQGADNIGQRGGWMCVEAHCAGMITNWGAHHVDIAQWGMGTELTGPISAVGTADFMNYNVWNVPRSFHVEMMYASGVKLTIDCGTGTQNGVRFIGEGGEIFVARSGARTTASDPANATASKGMEVSDPKILQFPIPSDGFHCPPSPTQHQNWLEAIKKGTEPIAPAEVGHRSCSVCMVAQIAMKNQGKKFNWDPKKERFTGANAEIGNAMRSRPQRAGFGTNMVLKKAGIKIA